MTREQLLKMKAAVRDQRRQRLDALRASPGYRCLALWVNEGESLDQVVAKLGDAAKGYDEVRGISWGGTGGNYRPADDRQSTESLLPQQSASTATHCARCRARSGRERHG